MNNFGWEAPWGSFGGGGGVKKPANPDDILQWLTAYDGVTPFVDKKTLVDSPATVGVNALDFDGTQIVTTGLTNPKNDWYVSACINLDTMAHNHEVVSLAATSSVRYIYILTDGRLQCRINGTIYTSTGTITFNQRVRIVSKRVADVVTLEAYTQGGSLLFSDVVASNSSTLNDGDVIVGGRTTGTFVEGVINGVIVGTSEEDLLFNYPMEEGSGLPYDVSGNGNHATTNNATWAKADGIESANLSAGHTPQVMVAGVPETPLANEIPVDGGKMLLTIPPYTVRTIAGGTTRYNTAISERVYDAEADEYNTVAMKTKSQLTTDGVGDKLTKAGILPADNYTVTGTAVPTAGTDEITFTAGTVKTLLLDGVVVADFTDQVGKTVTEVDGYTIAGYSSLEAVWGSRFADTSGIVVDSTNYLPITNHGGYVHNGAECSIVQTDANFAVFGVGTTLWGNGVNTWTPVSYADLLAEPSYATGGWYKWVNINGVCHLKEWLQYEFDREFTEAEYEKNARYVGAGGGCGSIDPF